MYWDDLLCIVVVLARCIRDCSRDSLGSAG